MGEYKETETRSLLWAVLTVALTTAKYQLWTNCLLLPVVTTIIIFLMRLEHFLLVCKQCPILTVRRALEPAAPPSPAPGQLSPIPPSLPHHLLGLPAVTVPFISILSLP